MPKLSTNVRYTFVRTDYVDRLSERLEDIEEFEAECDMTLIAWIDSTREVVFHREHDDNIMALVRRMNEDDVDLRGTVLVCSQNGDFSDPVAMASCWKHHLRYCKMYSVCGIEIYTENVEYGFSPDVAVVHIDTESG